MIDDIPCPTCLEPMSSLAASEPGWIACFDCRVDYDPAALCALSSAPALPDVDQPDDDDAHHRSPRRLRAVLSRRRDSRA